MTIGRGLGSLDRHEWMEASGRNLAGAMIKMDLRRQPSTFPGLGRCEMLPPTAMELYCIRDFYSWL